MAVTGLPGVTELAVLSWQNTVTHSGPRAVKGVHEFHN